MAIEKSHAALQLENSLHTLQRIAITSLNVASAEIVVVAEGDLTFFRIAAGNTEPLDTKLAETLYQQGAFQKQALVTNNNLSLLLSGNIRFYACLPINSKRGNVLGYLLIFDNKTRTLTAQEQLLMHEFSNIAASSIEQHFETQKLLNVFTDFIHKAVHDLKNPFTAISLSTELLKRKAEHPTLVNNFAGRIENASQRALKNLELIKQAFPLMNKGFKPKMQEISVEELIKAQQLTFPSKVRLENTLSENFFADFDKLNEAIALLIDLLQPAANITMKTYNDDASAFIELVSHSMIKNTDGVSALLIANALLAMHKGSITAVVNEELKQYGFQICLPLSPP